MLRDPRPDSMGSWKKIFDLNFGLGQNNTADYIYPRRPSILGNWELVKLWSSCCTYPGASFILFYVKKEDSRRESLLKAVLSYSLTITRCQERTLLMLWPAWHAQKGEGQPSTQANVLWLQPLCSCTSFVLWWKSLWRDHTPQELLVFQYFSE